MGNWVGGLDQWPATLPGEYSGLLDSLLLRRGIQKLSLWARNYIIISLIIFKRGQATSVIFHIMVNCKHTLREKHKKGFNVDTGKMLSSGVAGELAGSPVLWERS